MNDFQTLLASLEAVPGDPILGQMEQFESDRRPNKINLAVGMYFDGTGQVPQLHSIMRARNLVEREPFSNAYLPIDGLPAFREAARVLVFGDALEASGRTAVTIQTLGGTGALALGAELLARTGQPRKVYISDPSWENHGAIFASCGFEVAKYPYYDAASNCVAFDALTRALQEASARSVVVLHASCHNPTGLDLTQGQWSTVVEICACRGLIAFVDMAYQGFANGIEQDRSCIEEFARAGVDLLVANSFSKNMSLYKERVGALHVVCQNAELERVRAHAKQIARARYSNPPAFGARLASKVLTDETLRKEWQMELAEIRQRIRDVRLQLRDLLAARGLASRAEYLTRQQGMFGYTGLSARQMFDLRSKFGVYGLDTGRICVAAVNSSNLSNAAEAMAAVMLAG